MNKEPGQWKEISNRWHKKTYVNTKTGEHRTFVDDQRTRELRARGDFLQPVGKDTKEWLDKYKEYKMNHKGELVNVEMEKAKDKEYNEGLEKDERESFEKRDKIHKNKFYLSRG